VTADYQNNGRRMKEKGRKNWEKNWALRTTRGSPWLGKEVTSWELGMARLVHESPLPRAPASTSLFSEADRGCWQNRGQRFFPLVAEGGRAGSIGSSWAPPVGRDSGRTAFSGVRSGRHLAGASSRRLACLIYEALANDAARLTTPGVDKESDEGLATRAMEGPRLRAKSTWGRKRGTQIRRATGKVRGTI